MANLTLEQGEELIKCSRDVGYFVRNYCWIRHPAILGTPIRFTPWDWQESLLYAWAAGYNTISDKSRQIGWSWDADAYSLWRLIFNQGIEVYMVSANEDKAVSMMRKLQYMFDRLPDWMRPREPTKGGRSRTQMVMRLRYYDSARDMYDWGTSFAKSLTTTGSSGAGESANIVVADEVGLWKERQDDEQTWAAIAPTTTHGGQLIMGSTPRGYGGVFHRIWVEAVTPLMNEGVVNEFTPYREWNRKALEFYRGKPSFIPLKNHYSLCYHDEEWIEQCCRDMSAQKAGEIREHFSNLVYDTAWRDRQAKRMGLSASMILQEFELLFDKPGNAAFDSGSLTRCYKPLAKSPEIAALLKKSKCFFGGVDTAEGVSRTNRQPDFNSITVLTDRGIQSDALHIQQCTISDWAGATDRNPVTGALSEVKGKALEFMERFQPSDWVVEKNGPGLTLINRIENLLPMKISLIPMAMSSHIKPVLVSDFALAIEDGLIIITDYFTLECCRQYINKGGGKFEAAPGFYDDPVVAIMWAYWLLKQHGFYDLKLDGPSATDADQRIIGVTPDDDLMPKEADAPASTGFGPMSMPDVEYMEDVAGVRSSISERPFRGRGRRDDERFKPGRRHNERLR